MALTGLKETLTIAANIGVDITLADYEARELVIHLTAADALEIAAQCLIINVRESSGQLIIDPKNFDDLAIALRQCEEVS